MKTRILGIIFIVIGCILWGGIFIMPFLDISTSVRLTLAGVLAVIGEVLFWVGTALVGKEIVKGFLKRGSRRKAAGKETLPWKSLEQIKEAFALDDVCCVDVSPFEYARAQKCDRALVFAIALSKTFLRDLHDGHPVQTDDYLQKDERAEATADEIALRLRESGFAAISLSEQSNISNHSTEIIDITAPPDLVNKVYFPPGEIQGISPIPLKTLGVEAGIGFVGKSNLLIHDCYGSAMVLGAVLTNAPLPMTKHEKKTSRCGSCEACKKACPSGALTGKEWTGNRDDLIEVEKCCCAIGCIVSCPLTRRYYTSKDKN